MLLTTVLMMSIVASPAALPARYLALGDSYTIGESVEVDARWPNFLVAQLRASGVDIANPDIIARTGWTTDELSAALDTLEAGGSVGLTDSENAPRPTPPYQWVSLLIGVNNQYRGGSLDAYREQFRGLLQRAVAYADNLAERVIVLSIPDWGVTPFARNNGRDSAVVGREIDRFNAVARDEAQAAGIEFVDITALTREAGNRPELLAEDGLHPSAIDYARWAQAVFPWASRALTE